MFLWISVFNCPRFCKYPFGYPSISMYIHALTCNGFSIQGSYKDVGINQFISPLLITASAHTGPWRQAGKRQQMGWIELLGVYVRSFKKNHTLMSPFLLQLSFVKLECA